LRSRFLSPETGRFLSRDTWQGDYNRPLSLNRWNYVESNPVNLIDPLGQYSIGNYGCYDTQDSICRLLARLLKDYALQIKDSVKYGNTLPVEGFAQIAEKAELLFERDRRGMMWALTFVLDGMDANIPMLLAQQAKSGNYGTRASNKDRSDLFAGVDLLPYNNIHDRRYPVGAYSERGDWRAEYWDHTANQAYHFWFYVGVAFFDDEPLSLYGNNEHDPEDKWEDSSNAPTQAGITKPDWNLGVAGARLGSLLRQDYIMFQANCSSTIISNIRISSWIRANLKDIISYRGGR
jgi:hypothetical protein